MSCLRVGAVITLAFAASACINSAALIKIKPDGSGTVEQTMLINSQALKGIMGGLDPQGQMKQSGGVLNEAEFKRTAERMGVRTVSLTPIKDGAFEGAKAVFAFDDITKVRIDQDPQMAGSGGFGKPAGSGSPIRFDLTREGGTSRLTITVDDKMASDAANKSGVTMPATPPTLDPAMMGMIKQMFQGFKVAIDLEVEGKIVKTNADYVNGSRITLLELDVERLMSDEAALKSLQSKLGPGLSIADVRPLLKNVKGVKINHPVLTIEYR